MKKLRFSEPQIAFILKQVDEGTTIEEVCRKAGVSQQTYYRWRKKYVLVPTVNLPFVPTQNFAVLACR